MNCDTRMVADVGGTNTRIALFDPAAGELRALTVFKNRDYQRFEDVISAWLGNLDEPAPQQCCIAVAAPPSRDLVKMSNMDWSFSCSELARRHGFRRLVRINDFESNAYALPHLGSEELTLLHRGEVTGPSPSLAVVGPGTGLGGGFLIRMPNGEHRAQACEPGHSGLSPVTELEMELFALLLSRHEYIYTELLVSGPGLLRLYQALAEIRGTAAPASEPAEISRRAVTGTEELSVLALNTFCGLLGSACGDFLLTTGSYGGLYLAGGILPGMTPFLSASPFLQRLQAKGAMRDQLARVPVQLIKGGYPGLIGAAHAPLN
jgi:glucokinase